MSSEQHRSDHESGAGIPVAVPTGERGTCEDEPVVTTPAVRVWEITLPPETEAALRVRGF